MTTSDSPKLSSSVPPDFSLAQMAKRMVAGHKAVLEAAHLLDADAPSEEEEDNHEMYVRRLQTLFELRHEDAVTASESAYEQVTQASALPWAATWFSTRVAGAIFGLSKLAMAYKDANEHCAQAVPMLTRIGLYQAAWFKTSDSIYFAGKYFETAVEMTRLGLEQ